MPRTRRKGFLPAAGRLAHLAFPPPAADLRIDSGVEQGDEISTYYDPMIAKLIVRGPTAPLRCAPGGGPGGLADRRPATNLAFLRAVAAPGVPGEGARYRLHRARPQARPAERRPRTSTLLLAALAAAALSLAGQRRRAGLARSDLALASHRGWRLNRPRRGSCASPPASGSWSRVERAGAGATLARRCRPTHLRPRRERKSGASCDGHRRATWPPSPAHGSLLRSPAAGASCASPRRMSQRGRGGDRSAS